MKQFDIKIYSFGDRNHLQQQLSFPTLESGDPLSPPPKEAEKKREWNLVLKLNLVFLLVFFTVVLCLPIQPSLKKIVRLGSNLGLKGFNCVK